MASDWPIANLGTVKLQILKYFLLFSQVSKQVTKTKCNIVSPTWKSPVKWHKWTYQEERALVEFLSVSKTDPKYGLEDDIEWHSFRDGHSVWSDAATHIKTSISANILLTSTYKTFPFIIKQQI